MVKMFFPKTKQLLIATPVFTLISELTFLLKYFILLARRIVPKSLSYLISCSVKEEEYLTARERFYFKTAQLAIYKNICTTTRAVLLVLFFCILSPKFALSVDNETEILIFSLSPEKVEK